MPTATNDALIKSQLLDELLRASQMLTSEEVAVFDRTVQALSGLGFSSRELEVLFSMFADDTPHHEVMWGLLHLVEASDGDSMVSALVNQLRTCVAWHQNGWRLSSADCLIVIYTEMC